LNRILLLVFGIVMTLPGFALAEVSVANVFGSHMVIQQDKPIRLWGRANVGEKIQVSINDEKQTTTANVNGRWQVQLKSRSAKDHPDPLSITIAGSDNTVALKNVLIGEVWLCAGQSNMQWRVFQSVGGKEAFETANYPHMRLMSIPNVASGEPQENLPPGRSWQVCTPSTTRTFSGVAFFFGRQLHETLDVPIGLINSSWGGTRILGWTSRDTLTPFDFMAPTIKAYDESLPGYEAKYEQFLKDREKWMVAVRKAHAAGKDTMELRRARPRIPFGPRHRSGPGTIYNHMIHPLKGFAIAGVLWYQGESDAIANQGPRYRELLPAMIQNWRQLIGDESLPFGIIQLPNFRPREESPNPKGVSWAYLRESQFMTAQADTNTGLITTIDIGDGKDLHPPNKKDFADRAAQWALGAVYRQPVMPSGPTYDRMQIEDNTIRLFFKQTGGGLKASDGGKLLGLAVAGEDKVFHWATATIDGDTIVVQSEQVSSPLAVRYAWADNPVCNLVGNSGLTASPFRTDRW